MNQHKLLLTDLGKDKLATASTAGGSVLISDFAVGQGIDVDFSQRLDKQTLVSKRYQSSVQSVREGNNAKQYEVHCVIPADVGGWTVRELALIDEDGDLIWVGQLPSVEKTIADNLSAVDYRLTAVIDIDNPDVNLVVDINVVTATKTWVDENYIPRSALELIYPIGHPYWSSSPADPSSKFDALFGYKTYWKRVQGVELVAIKDSDSNISTPHKKTGKAGHVSTNSSNPDLYPIYPLYLWMRINEPVKYDGKTLANGSAQFM